MKYQGILFDLDGTLVDTAPDIASALNLLRREQDLPPLPLATIRAIVSEGSQSLLKVALNIDANHPHYSHFRDQFFSYYEKQLASETQLFSGILKVLEQLDKDGLPWGIVTNKLTRHTKPLLARLKLNQRAHCLVCGDTLSTCKPDPAPIRFACQQLKINNNACLFVGDSLHDVNASKAAGSHVIVALYGYIAETTNPKEWQADGYIETPEDILGYL